MSEPLDLDAIRRRAAWMSDREHPTSGVLVARTAYDVPDLLDEVDRLRAELDAERAGHREQRAAALRDVAALCDGADRDQAADHPSLRMVFVKDVRAAMESS